jgi:hypothetical protein
LFDSSAKAAKAAKAAKGFLDWAGIQTEVAVEWSRTRVD